MHSLIPVWRHDRMIVGSCEDDTHAVYRSRRIFEEAARVTPPVVTSCLVIITMKSDSHLYQFVCNYIALQSGLSWLGGLPTRRMCCISPAYVATSPCLKAKLYSWIPQSVWRSLVSFYTTGSTWTFPIYDLGG